MTFLWGAATSSHQIEGGNRHNDWWQWEASGNIEGGALSGDATDHWHRFEEDLKLAADLGLNTYRFSIEWSRVEPKEGQWDKSALDWYLALVLECEKRGLQPMVTLLHFTIPQWLAEKGGFTWEHSAEKFAGFTRKVAQHLGAHVPLWCTLNEPNVMVLGQYLAGFMPPAVYNPKLAAVASRNLLLAHIRAYDILHEIKERRGPWASTPLMVGFANNMIDFAPLRRAHPAESILARLFRRFYNSAWPDAVMGRRQHFGVRGLVPFARQVGEGRGRRTCDFIGINYYTRVYVCFGPQQRVVNFARFRSLPVGVCFSREGERVSDLGWVLHPRGMGRMIRYLGRHKVPLIITENGIADHRDQLRPEYLQTHLMEIADMIAKGYDVRGYYHWSLLDNFEWIKGFVPRFGLYEVDYGSFARTPRGSAQQYAQIIARHGGGPPLREKLSSLNDRVPAGLATASAS